MMKHLVISLIALCCFIDVQAQKITRSYDNVSMSEALRDLNELSPDYTISFMYNELEDFRVTTSIKHQSVPDALRQIIGFYPIRVSEKGKGSLFVECIQKTSTRYKGHIIDEKGQPIAYANVCLLSPSDSMIVGGGVSNEAGLFVIPCDVRPVVHPADGDCIFVLADNYLQLEIVRRGFPNLHIVSLCQPQDQGYDHKAFCTSGPQEKRAAIIRLIVSVDLLLHAKKFVGSITTGPSVFIMKQRYTEPSVIAVDCAKELLESVLTLPIDQRAAISADKMLTPVKHKKGISSE